MRRRSAVVDAPEVVGRARLGRDTAALLARLRPGDVAVLDHVDLDAATARALLAAGVVAVVNAAPSTSGRYPNLGPAVLVAAGLPLLDGVGPEVLDLLRDGAAVRLDDDRLLAGDREVARGCRQDDGSVAEAAALARAGLAAQLADLATNATGFLLDERDLLLEGQGVPPLPVADRPVVVVADGPGAVEELALLRAYLRAARPVLVGVEGGAELLLDRGLRPDVVLGDLDRLSARALARGRCVVGRGTPGPTLEVVPFATAVASDDMALLAAVRGGATCVVAVGYPTSVEQVLDRGRAGAPSALLVRLGVLDRVVGARAVAALTPAPFPRWSLLLLVLSTAAAVVAAVAFAGGQGLHPELLDTRLRELLPW